MKKLPLLLSIVVLAGASIWFFACNNRNEDYRIVTLAGADTYGNMTDPYILMQVGNGTKGVSSLPLCNDDLIFGGGENNGIYYRYTKKDGTSLKFRTEGFKNYLNDRLMSVEVSNEPAVLEWFNGITREEVSDFQHIVIVDSLSGEMISGLKKLADLKPNIGIVFENPKSQQAEVLSLFNTTWLMAPEGFPTQSAQKIVGYLSNLELLAIPSENLDSKLLSRLKKLKTLILIDMDASTDLALFQLPTGLKKLTILGSALSDLKILGGAQGLQELNLLGCDSLMDISLLADHKNLTRISLAGCKNLGDLTPMDHLKLEKLSFPVKITDKEFVRFVGLHPELREIGLIGCEPVPDLAPLKSLPGLSCLSIAGSNFPAEKVYPFTSLDYLSFPLSVPADSAKLRELSERLPNTVVVPSAGLCLGSGWLLLFVPLFLFLLIPISILLRREKIRISSS